jgi:hypothetical protein
MPEMCGPRGLKGGLNRLWRNDSQPGRPKFTDVSQPSKITAPGERFSLSATTLVTTDSKGRGPSGPLVDTHVHLFADDQRRFPHHPKATYEPPPQALEPYAKFVREPRIDHAIIVHPELYQDDHRYLEYCFVNEPSR